MKPSLAVSIVTYFPDLAVLEETFRSLGESLRLAVENGRIGGATMYIVDNGGPVEGLAPIRRIIEETCPGFNTRLITGGGNIGYGRGHNLAIRDSKESYHLVLNPDVILERTAISEAIDFMEGHTDVAMLSPSVKSAKGEKEYLCKTYPNPIDLLLRGFSPKRIRLLFSKRLNRYMMKGVTEDHVVMNVPVASGCFMFMRREPLSNAGGFCEDYFMYFEDFDLSLRIGNIAYVPAVRIIHLGGNAAKKGWRHIKMFASSAFKFYRRNSFFR